MPQETHRPFTTFAVGRHARLPGLAKLHRACLTTLIALVVQFGLGMWLNLYVPVPAADQHAGIAQEIRNGPLLLTVHVLAGTFLIGAAIVAVIKAASTRDTTMTVLTAAGLGAIVGAFAAGEFFASDDESAASLWMAALTGVALLCYICTQALASAARMAQLRRRYAGPREREREPMPRFPHHSAAVPPWQPRPPGL